MKAELPSSLRKLLSRKYSCSHRPASLPQLTDNPWNTLVLSLTVLFLACFHCFPLGNVSMAHLSSIQIWLPGQALSNDTRSIHVSCLILALSSFVWISTLLVHFK